MLEAIEANDDKHLWVGISRTGPQNQMQLLDGSSSQHLVLDWFPGEPNGAVYGENCAHVIATTSQMNDNPCDQTFTSFGMYLKIAAPIYGLCERVVTLDDGLFY